jgi:hypothetical protein
MLPSEALAHEFDKHIRDRGDAYVRPGLIQIVAGTAVQVSAVVQGSLPYDVRIERVPAAGETAFVASCSCPHFVDHFEACKHVWATLKFAEQAGYLRGADGPPLTRQSAYLEFDVKDDVVAPPTGRPGRRARPAPPSPATTFLTSVTQQLLKRDSQAAPARYADATFLYVIDGPQSLADHHVVVNVMTQKRTRQGAIC